MPFPDITALPTPPARNDDPTTFSNRADALLAALPGFVTEVNAAGDYIDTDVATSVSNAAASAANAATSETNAATSETNAAASATAAEGFKGTAETAAAAAQAAAGLPSLAGNAGAALLVNGSADGVGWGRQTSHVLKSQTIESSGTWNAPANLIGGIAWLSGCGAGGGGGGAATWSGWARAGGGSAGGSCELFPVRVTPSTGYTVTIGAGGVGGSNVGSNGAAGGSTSFDSLLTLPGGNGGNGRNSSGNSSGGAAVDPLSASGDIGVLCRGFAGATGGNDGTDSRYHDGGEGTSVGGGGGASLYGPGGGGGSNAAGQTPASGYGGGGGGASSSGTGVVGGAGADGVMTVHWIELEEVQ